MCDESGGEGLASKKRVGLRWYRGVETGSAGIESKGSLVGGCNKGGGKRVGTGAIRGSIPKQACEGAILTQF